MVLKAKYTGPTVSLLLTHDKIYDVLSVEKGWFRIVDDAGDYPDEELPGYLYPPELFEIVEE